MAHKVWGSNDDVSGGYDYEELCPGCDGMVAVKMDWNQPDLETVCPDCGRKLMICTACCDWNNRCDWTKKGGCHMDKAHICAKDAR